MRWDVVSQPWDEVEDLLRAFKELANRSGWGSDDTVDGSSIPTGAQYVGIVDVVNTDTTRVSNLSPTLARPGAFPRSTWLSANSTSPR